MLWVYVDMQNNFISFVNKNNNEQLKQNLI